MNLTKFPSIFALYADYLSRKQAGHHLQAFADHGTFVLGWQDSTSQERGTVRLSDVKMRLSNPSFLGGHPDILDEHSKDWASLGISILEMRAGIRTSVGREGLFGGPHLHFLCGEPTTEEAVEQARAEEIAEIQRLVQGMFS